MPFFEKRAAGLCHNSAYIIDSDGSEAGLYRKMHIPDDPSYYEKFYFTPGDLGFKAWDTRYGRIGILICWDQWYPEAARLTLIANLSQIAFLDVRSCRAHQTVAPEKIVDCGASDFEFGCGTSGLGKSKRRRL